MINRLLLFSLLMVLPPELAAQSTALYHTDLYNAIDTDTPFPFGIASGDPSNSSIILWTKILGSGVESATIGWNIASDSSMFNVVQSGRYETDASRAFTVKIEVSKLQAGQTYFYQFSYKGEKSEVGRTRTAAHSPDKLRFAVVSCSDFQTGHFNAYRHIATRHDLDIVLHLGDYIYETSAKKWGPKKQKKRMYREHIPSNLLVSLQDYRTRYGQYRLDPYLHEAHRLHPFVTVWDDHEFTNNVNSDDKSERDASRKQAARKAYFEWLPVRDDEDLSIYRSIGFGSLAELFVIDTRMEDRTAQAEGEEDPTWQAEDRTMIGEEQFSWLTSGLKTSQAKWKIMGNQVIFSPLHDSKVFSRVPAVKMDRWDGYPAEQMRILHFLEENDIEDFIVVTGDVHTSWALEITPSPLDPTVYNPSNGTGVLGAEFVTPSISSFNMNDILPRPIAWEAERRFRKKKYNPHLRYLDLVRHGYLTMTFTKDEARADWLFFNPRRSTAKIQQQKSWSYRQQKIRKVK